MAKYKLIKNCRYGFAVSELKIRGPAPDQIVKVSDNEVYADYGNFRQTWTAAGEGNERHNFNEKIEVIGE